MTLLRLLYNCYALRLRIKPMIERVCVSIYYYEQMLLTDPAGGASALESISTP